MPSARDPAMLDRHRLQGLCRPDALLRGRRRVVDARPPQRKRAGPLLQLGSALRRLGGLRLVVPGEPRNRCPSALEHRGPRLATLVAIPTGWHLFYQTTSATTDTPTTTDDQSTVTTAHRSLHQRPGHERLVDPSGTACSDGARSVAIESEAGSETSKRNATAAQAATPDQKGVGCESGDSAAHCGHRRGAGPHR